jgi:hypothetical protein
MHLPTLHATADWQPVRVRRRNARKARAAVLIGVKRLMEMGDWANESHSSDRYLPKLLRARDLHHGFSSQELQDAMRSLIRDGKLFRVKIDTYRNFTPCFALVSLEGEEARHRFRPSYEGKALFEGFAQMDKEVIRDCPTAMRWLRRLQWLEKRGGLLIERRVVTPRTLGTSARAAKNLTTDSIWTERSGTKLAPEPNTTLLH